MKRVVILISLLIAILSSYGQQQVQWFDVSNFTPSVKQCMVSFTDDKLYVYVNTGDKDVNFWVGEPQRTGALVMLNGNDMMEFRQGVFNEFITESLRSLPENATIQPHIQRTEVDETYPLANLEIDVQRVDKELLEQGLSNEELADYYAKQNENSQTSKGKGDDDNVMSGIIQQSNGGLSQQQSNHETKQSDRKGSGLEGILENILMLLIGYWLLKAIFKLFGSSSSAKKGRREKSDWEKNYEDGPAWFHDHGQKI